MIPFEEIDARLSKLGKNRTWLAEKSGRSADSIRGALAPNAPPAKRSELLQKALSDAIEGEEHFTPQNIPGYSEIFLSDAQLDLVDKASRVAGSASLKDFCRDAIQAHAKVLLEAKQVKEHSSNFVINLERERDAYRDALKQIAANPGWIDDEVGFMSGHIAAGVLNQFSENV